MVALLWVAAVGVQAQVVAPGAPPITDAQVRDAQTKARQQLDKLTPQAVREANRQPVEQHLKDGAIDPRKLESERAVPPRLERLPNVGPSGAVDLGALSDMVLRQAKPLNEQLAAIQPSLYVFVSLSMPQQSLRALAEQVTRAQGTMVLRGFPGNSMRKTPPALRKAFGTTNVPVQVHPEAFDRYAVTVVPTFVLARAPVAQGYACGAAQCQGEDEFLAVSGDVTLAYALDKLEGHGPAFRAEARHFIDRLSVRSTP